MFVDKLRQAANNHGKKDLKKDVIICQRKKKGKFLMQANNLSTKAIMNQGIYEMRMKMYEKAVENFSFVNREGPFKNSQKLRIFQCAISLAWYMG